MPKDIGSSSLFDRINLGIMMDLDVFFLDVDVPWMSIPLSSVEFG